jgi:hypothetical protein
VKKYLAALGIWDNTAPVGCQIGLAFPLPALESFKDTQLHCPASLACGPYLIQEMESQGQLLELGSFHEIFAEHSSACTISILSPLPLKYISRNYQFIGHGSQHVLILMKGYRVVLWFHHPDSNWNSLWKKSAGLCFLKKKKKIK